MISGLVVMILKHDNAAEELGVTDPVKQNGALKNHRCIFKDEYVHAPTAIECHCKTNFLPEMKDSDHRHAI
jgi:hypothetical protein